jgi:uroporphyrinogen-III synthase
LERDVEGGEALDLSGIAVRQGMGALITRPREEAESLSAALAARGIAAVIEPMMLIDYRAAPSPDLAGVQAVLCTSANGVRALARLTGERGLPLFAVGDATAARARAEGFTAVASAGGAVTDLVRLAVAELRPHDGRLLHIAGDVVAGDLAGALRAHGFAIERRVLYEARPVGALSTPAVSALRRGMIDFALFFSPRSAAIFVRLAGIADVAGCCRMITTLAISAAVDAVLADLPWRDRRVAESPNQPSLLAALDAALAERQQA